MAENALTFRHKTLVALPKRRACLALLLLVAFPAGQAASETVLPRVQAVPLPDKQVSFEIDGLEVARCHYGPSAPKPYVFPLIGPAGRRLTRLTHPHDPEGHGHHRSIWIAHQDVNGVNFWEESSARIVHQRIERYADGREAASITIRNLWQNQEGKALLEERRTVTLRALPRNERYLDIKLEFTPAADPVTLGKTPFGFLGVRVAKTMGVKDGGGTIRNSEGGVNEAGVFRKRARWVDYSGPVSTTARNGITIFDHPDNPRFPSYFRVRDDGWMGTSFCLEAPYEIVKGKTLALHYRLYAHTDEAAPKLIEEHWRRFADE